MVGTKLTTFKPFRELLSIFRRQGLILRDLGWQAGVGKEAWKELLLGAVIGAPLGILWIYVIEPVLSSLQGTEGGTYRDSKVVCDWGDHSFLIAPHSLNPLYDVKTLEKQGSICPGDFYPWQKSDRPIVVNLAELSWKDISRILMGNCHHLSQQVSYAIGFGQAIFNCPDSYQYPTS